MAGKNELSIRRKMNFSQPIVSLTSHFYKKGAIVESIRRLLPLTGLLFILGVSGLVRFSQDVRSVEVVGLSGSGFALGIGFALLVLGLSGRIKPRRDAEGQ